MGKGGMSQGGSGEDGVEENMAAWLLGVNNLKIQPFHLPPLGIQLFSLVILLNHPLSYIHSSSSLTFSI